MIGKPQVKMSAMRIVVAATALGYLGISLWSGWDAVIRAVTEVGELGILVGLVLTLGNIGFRFIRWQCYLRALGCEVPWAESLRIFLAGFAVAITPGGAGEPVVRGLLLKPFRADFQRTFAAYVAERVSDVICVLALTMLGLFAYPAVRPAVAGITVVIATSVLLLRRDVWLNRLRERLRGKGGTFGRLASHGVEIILQLRPFFAAPMLAKGLMWGLVAWGLTGAGFYYIVHLAGSDVTLQIAVFVYSFSILVGALSFLPGGLGSSEATMIGLLLVNGMPQAQAIAVTILSRIVTLWFSVGIGVWCLSLPPRQVDRREDQSV